MIESVQMKFLHIADVHLGCTRYQLAESPRDFFDAWIDVLRRYALSEPLAASIPLEDAPAGTPLAGGQPVNLEGIASSPNWPAAHAAGSDRFIKARRSTVSPFSKCFSTISDTSSA